MIWPNAFRSIVAFSLLVASTPAFPNDVERSVLAAIKAALPSSQEDVDISLSTAPPEPCEQPIASLPYQVPERGGRVSVTLKCTGQPTQYLRAQVQINTRYVLATRNIDRGELITADLLAYATGDRATLPRNVITDKQGIIGSETTRKVKSGGFFQSGSVQPRKVINRRDKVTVEAKGTGFSIRQDGVALDAGGIDSVIRVKLDGGEIVSGSVVGKGAVKLAL